MHLLLCLNVGETQRKRSMAVGGTTGVARYSHPKPLLYIYYWNVDMWRVCVRGMLFGELKKFIALLPGIGWVSVTSMYVNLGYV